MKKFLKKSQGFTIVELMIVIAIISMLFIAMQYFSNSPGISQQRVEILSGKIAQTLRDTKTDMTLGKAFQNGNEMKFAHSREVKIFTKNAWNASNRVETCVNIDDSTDCHDENKNFSAILENDKNYSIEKIEVTNKRKEGELKNPTNWQSYESIKIIFQKDLTGKVLKIDDDKNASSDITFYRITLDYRWFKRYIIGDALTGNIDTDTVLE